jgi:hypothetical protein
VTLPVRAALPRALGTFKPEALILVSLGNAHATSVDLQVRQLRRRLAGVKLGVAQWSGAGEVTAAPSAKAGADFTATDMEQVFSNAFGKATTEAAKA